MGSHRKRRHVERPRTFKAFAVDGGDHHAAPRPVFGHKLTDQSPAFHVQRRRRLIQQPDRPWLDQQADQRQPALLPGRKPPARNLFPPGQTDSLHGGDSLGRVAAKVSRPESGLFGSRFGGFHGVEVTKKVVFSTFDLLWSCARIAHLSGVRTGQTSENAKQC